MEIGGAVVLMLIEDEALTYFLTVFGALFYGVAPPLKVNDVIG